jgi:hypothetical protein
LKGLASFGLYERDWMKAKWPKDPSIGNIEAEVFDPAKWKTEYPNPALNQMDAADAFWAASIVSRFTNTMIQSIVEDARLSNPEASACLADVIIRRRDKVVRWGITQTNPLDRFQVRATAVPELTFENAAARLGVAANETRYRVQWWAWDNRAARRLAPGDPVTSADHRFVVPDSAWGPKDDGGVRYAIASIATLDPAFTHWVMPVEVTIRDRDGLLDVVGIDRIPTGASNAARLPTGGAK